MSFQIQTINNSSLIYPATVELPMATDEILTANLILPQLNVPITQITLTDATETTDLTFDSATNYYAFISGTTQLPISYSFMINNNTDHIINIVNSDTVSLTAGVSEMEDNSTYLMTIHFNATGSIARMSAIKIA